MVSTKDKGKDPMEDDLQDPGQEKKIKSEDEEETKHTGTTIASIGVVASYGDPAYHCMM